MAENSTRKRGRPRGWHDRTEQNTIKSLDRALEVLIALGAYEGVTLSVLAQELGQSPATLYRVLMTLQGRGFAEFDEVGQAWSVGAGAYLAGAAFLRRTSLAERARPIMRALMEATGETANLGIARGDEVMFLSQVETHETIRAFFAPGTLSPLHASGIGKALLSRWPVDRLEAWLARSDRKAFTEHTLVKAEVLRADLAEAAVRGYAVEGEEKAVGMRCVAAPVFDVFGEAVAGISISGPAVRLPMARIDECGGHVMRAAQALSEAIGGTLPR